MVHDTGVPVACCVYTLFAIFGCQRRVENGGYIRVRCASVISGEV